MGWFGLAVLGWFTDPPWLLEKERVGQEEPNHVGQQLGEVGGHASFLSPRSGLSAHLPGDPGEGVRKPDLPDSWLSQGH